MSHHAPIVIIGSGLAGYAIVRELRKLNSTCAVVLISLDHAGFYSKPMLSNAFATGKTPKTIISADAAKMAKQQKITIRPFTKVIGIDQLNKILLLDNKEKLSYSQLVLALGADQVRLPLQGDGVTDILSVNDVDDYQYFRNSLKDKKRVSIIGAGLIGCEFANDLTTAGYQVQVIDISEQPLGRLLPAAGGRFMQKKLEEIGIIFHLRATVKRVERINGCLGIVLASGKTISSDVILSAVGLRPRLELAKECGIKVNRGIIVNQLLQTQYDNIYALGDCAEVVGKVLPFVMPISHSARALAATLTGNPTPVHYPAMPVMVKTPACPTVVSPPEPGMAGQWHVKADENGVQALFKNPAGNLLGFSLLGSAIQEKNMLISQLPPVLK